MLVNLHEITSNSFFAIRYFPISGVLITVGVFTLIYQLTGEYWLSGLTTFLMSLTVQRGLWTYGIDKVGFALFLYIILIILLRRLYVATDRVSILLLLYLAASLNMYYYTAGLWAVGVFITPIFLYAVLFINNDSFLQFPYLGSAVAMIIVFVYFTDPLYIGVPRLFGQFQQSLLRIYSHLPMIGQSNTVDGEFIYTGGRITNKFLATSLTYLKITYLLLLSAPVVFSTSLFIIRTRRFDRLKVLNLMLVSTFMIAMAETVGKLLLGQFIIRLHFIHFAIFSPAVVYMLVKEYPKTGKTMKTFLIYTSCIFITSSSIFGIIILGGGMNYVDGNEIHKNSEWIEEYGNNYPVLSDLHTLSYVPIDNQLQITTYTPEIYRQVIGEQDAKSDKYILYNSQNSDKPVYTLYWNIYEPLGYHEHRINSNTDLDRIYDSNSSQIYK